MAPQHGRRRRPSVAGRSLPPITSASDFPTVPRKNQTFEELQRRYGFAHPSKGSKAVPSGETAVVARCREEAVKWLAGLGFSEVSLPPTPGGSYRHSFEVVVKEKRTGLGRQRHHYDTQEFQEGNPSSQNASVLNQVMNRTATVRGKGPLLEVDAYESFDDIKDAARKLIQQRRPYTTRRSSTSNSPPKKSNTKPRVQLKRIPTGALLQCAEDAEEDRESMVTQSARLDDAGRLSKGLLRKRSSQLKEKEQPRKSHSSTSHRRLSGGLGIERQSSGKMSFSARLTLRSEMLIQGSKFLNSEFVTGEDKMRIAFERFQDTQTQELHRESLPDVIKHLGLCRLPDHLVEEILNVYAPYSTLDWFEFTTFLRHYTKKEEENFREVFENFDEDGSGDISKDELMVFMVSVGFTPMQDMIEEAMAIADSDNSGALDYEEMCIVIRNYRQFEGFTRAEVASMEVVYEQYCPVLASPEAERRLPADRLAETLVDVFGAAHKDIAFNLQESVLQSHKKGVHQRPDLAFDEFLLWARRLREVEIESYRPIFASHDSDGSGNIDKSELKGMLKSMGLTPLDSLLSHLIQLSDRNEDNELNFEEFVHLMGILRRTEGFSEEEVVDFEEVFERFDEDESGEIDALEIVNVMRYLGFDATLEETHRLVAEVDANDSGAVDFREFLHLMRVWRENEIHTLQGIYDQHLDKDVGLLQCTPTIVFQALSQLGHKVDDEDQEAIFDLIGFDRVENGEGYCTLDRFIEIADKTRNFCTDKRAKYAGLKAPQVESYKKLFDEHCDGANVLQGKALSEMLKLLGCPLRTREEQQQIMRKISEAKDAAKRAGIRERELGSEGRVSWWVFLQLVGWLTDEANYKRFSHELEVVEETDFNPGQVTRFRMVFEEWAKLEFVRTASMIPKGNRSVTQFGATAPGGQETMVSWQFGRVTDKITIAGDTVRLGIEGMVLGMQHSLGITLTTNERSDLERNMRETDRKERKKFEEQPIIVTAPTEAPEVEEDVVSEEPLDEGKLTVDFCGFLHLLRWMLNKNFANIKDILLERLGY
mmetsp:Transcript_11952/g.27944  ORF Transcript_11952/g.27944 Transcript_11952/m.27944 type:complete len:1048 (-) Transcript_11952:208-3351(-)